MGMGEPLDNYSNVIKFLKIATNRDGLNISGRNISLSTCGVVDKINLLANEHLGITLSVSLHASNDNIRNKIMPINRKYNIKRLISSCKEYTKLTGRRISFEYTLISRLNDTPSCAKELSKLVKDMLCHVNLINLNVTSCKNPLLIPSPQSSVENFKNILLKSGVRATVRRSLGSDINAACGQLRKQNLNSLDKNITAVKVR